MKNQLENKKIAELFLYGLGLLSFGLIFIFLFPFFGLTLSILGLLLLITSFLSLLTKLYNKMLK